MDEQAPRRAALGPYRVLDLTDEKGVLCTKLLADLGADVIKVEPPGGDPMRRLGPFYHDEVHPEKSLFWFTFNTSKRSISLDITKRSGQDLLKRLVRTADFLVECFPPGYMDGLGLGYQALSEINPRLVVTSVTNFGQNGPYRDFKASDLIAVAMGGLMTLCGDEDRPPVRMRAAQAYAQAGAQAAVGTLIAHYHRQLTGEGQHVDVSMHEAIASTLESVPAFWDLNKVIAKRTGSFRGVARHPVRMIFPCKDGFVSASHFTSGPGFLAMAEWLESEGMAEDLNDPVWLEKSQNPPVAPEDLDHIIAVVEKFILPKEKQRLFEEGQRRRIMVCPVNTSKDLLESPQLRARDFFVEVSHPELDGTITYSGAPYKLSESPWRISRRPPLIGEHNVAVYGEELGLSRGDLIVLRQAGVI